MNDAGPGGRLELGRGQGIALTVWSVLGLLAAFTLSIDKVKLLEDPSFQPSCNFNPVLSCGSVMKTDQASVFGFPNPFLGLVAFGVTVTLGVLIATGVRLPRWVLAGGAVGATAGAVFVHWLAFQSLYRIEALCPWCMVVWAVTIPTALWFALVSISQYAARGSGLQRIVHGMWLWRFSLVAAWYLLVVVLALVQFWDYWSTLG